MTIQSVIINGTPYLAEDASLAIANRAPTRIVVANLMLENGSLVDVNPGAYADAEVTIAGHVIACVLVKFRRALRGERFANSVEFATRGLYLLSKLAYFQRWRSRQDDNPATLERTGFVVLNEGETGANIDVEAQLQDIFSAAGALYSGAPTCSISGGEWRDTKLPESEDRNLTCLQALERTQRFFPKIFVRDTLDTPGVVIGDNATAWTRQPSRFLVDDTLEDDTGVNAVNVEFIREGQGEGRPCFYVQKESVVRAGANPATLPLSTLDGTFMYNGARFSKTRTSLDVKTMDIADLYSKDLWRSLCPATFDGVLDQDITITGPTRSGEAEAKLSTSTSKSDVFTLDLSAETGAWQYLHLCVSVFADYTWRGLIDVVSGGFPCQDISNAGRGAGITGTKSGLWSEFARIICEVEPPLVFVKNSPMLASRGLDRILADLAAMGFDAEWCVLGADAVGAPHHRERLWLLAAHPARLGRRICTTQGVPHPRIEVWQHDTFNALVDACPPWPVDQPGAAHIPHGMATWLDELKALGNGQVPAVAAAAWCLLSARMGLA